MAERLKRRPRDPLRIRKKVAGSCIEQYLARILARDSRWASRPRGFESHSRRLWRLNWQKQFYGLVDAVMDVCRITPSLPSNLSKSIL